ncbi:hypothetical protein N665_0824s0009 [Sinapis alba]|nr:hypothetical protein N665_0824s0009 [Sinapis alba]
MSWVHAPSVAISMAVAFRLIRDLATTGGRKGRDNGFHGHSLHQLPLNGNHTRCFFLYLTLRRRTFSFGTHFDLAYLFRYMCICFLLDSNTTMINSGCELRYKHHYHETAVDYYLDVDITIMKSLSNKHFSI